MAKRAYSPKDVVKKTYRTIPWSDEWREVFGDVPDNEMWFIMGGSAGGKSSFVMKLAKELTNYGTVLYCSYEEGVSQSFGDRLRREKMTERQGRFRVVTDDTFEELKERLGRPKSAKYVIIDSFQESGFTYSEALELQERFPRKSFIYISQEYKGAPMGKGASRLKYRAGVKIKVSGHEAISQGRFAVGGVYTIWEDGVMARTNNATKEQVRVEYKIPAEITKDMVTPEMEAAVDQLRYQRNLMSIKSKI